jgi:hypothetical protein
MPAPYRGTCLCGRIEFELLADPLTFYVCHCTDCQRRTGGAALPVMWVRRRDIRVVSGEPVLHVFDLRNGKQRRSRLCAQCDTRLWAEPADKPDIAILRPGTLLDQSTFEPIAHLYVRSKQPWFSIPNDAVQFETQPAHPDELIRLWRQRGDTQSEASASP